MATSKELTYKLAESLDVNVQAERETFNRVIDKSHQSEANFGIWLARAMLDAAK